MLKSIYETSPGNFIFIDERDLKAYLEKNSHISQILVGNKSIDKKKKMKSYAPKVKKSRLGMKRRDSTLKVETSLQSPVIK